MTFGLVHTAYAAESGLDIHLYPFVLGHLGGMPITSTLLTTWFLMLLLLGAAYLIGKKPTLRPRKVQIAAEMLIGGVYDYMADVLESRQLAYRYFPVVMTIFIMVLAMNWVGLLPGIHSIGIYKQWHGVHQLLPFFYPPSTDLNVTIGLAIVAFVTVEVAGVSAIGFFKYANKFISFKSPLAFVIGLIELMSELARLIAFSFRLFGNIFAGKTLLLVVMFLVTPYVVPVPLMAYEFFVGFIQAFIFAILTLFFIKIAVIEEQH